MFKYEENGKIQGLLFSDTLIFSTVYSRDVISFSVDNSATKQICFRNIISGIISYGALSVPVISGLFAGFYYQSWQTGLAFLCLGLLLLMVFLFPIVSALDNLSEEEFYLKRAKQEVFSSEHPDYVNFGVNSRIFADYGTVPFWNKFLSLTDENLLREATSIMIMEQQLQEIVDGAHEYLSESNNSVLETEVRAKKDEAIRKLDNLTERFDNYIEKVLNHSENERDQKVLDLISKVDDIAA